MAQVQAQVVAHSLSPQGDELLSVLATFPRIILAEVNTHRMLSKNTASSRAIPFKRMAESVIADPFIPIAWQKEHSGMQGTEYFTSEDDIQDITGEYIQSVIYAVERAKVLAGCGVTKQLANRQLEPFMWTTMLITGSKEGWENFFDLRCPQYEASEGDQKTYSKSWRDYLKVGLDMGMEDVVEVAKDATILEKLAVNKGMAEIHMMALAEAIYDARNESTPKQLQAGEWHIPFEDKIDEGIAEMYSGQTNSEAKVKISTAMAARTSYTVVGDEKEINYENLLSLHDRLINQKPLHASPMEHCARAMNEGEYQLHIKGAAIFDRVNGTSFEDGSIGWCRNYRGFTQYRHILETQQK